MARLSLPTCSSLLTVPFAIGGVRRLGIGATLAFALDTPGELRAQTEVWPLVLPALSGQTVDSGHPKRVGEWLLAGRSFAPGGVPATRWDAAVRIGDSARRFAFTGPRIWEDGAITTQPARSADSGWTSAWGGAGVTDNPLGRGWCPEADRPVEGPVIEDPDHGWHAPDRPSRACSPAPLPMTHPGRLALMGAWTMDVAGAAFPGFPDDLDPAFFQCAPPAQRIGAPWQGDETFELHNWHPDREVIAGRLPGVRAVVHVGGGAGPLRAVPMRATTIWFVPEALLGLLVFHGETATARLDGSDITRVILGFEAIEAMPRPRAHYEALWETRTARTVEGAGASLDDAPLLPPGLHVRFDSVATMAAMVRKAIPAPRRPDRSLVDALDEARARRIGADGGDEAIFERIRANIATMDAAMANVMSDQDAGPDAWRDAAGAMLRRIYDGAADGGDPEDTSGGIAEVLAALTTMRGADDGPAPSDVGGIVDRLEEQRERLAGADTSLQRDHDRLLRLIAFGPQARGDDPPDRAALEDGLARVLAAAPVGKLPDPGLPPFPDLHALPERATFSELDRAMLSAAPDGWSASLRGGDLCQQLDLSRVPLRDVALRDVTLIDCDLRGVDLGSATWENVALIRCDLAGMITSGAAWRNVSLAACRLDGLVAPDAIMAVMISATDARASDWSGRTIEQMMVNGGDWQGADFSQARLDRCGFSDVAMAGSRFVDAVVRMTSWFGGTLADADWGGAHAHRASFHALAMPQHWRDAWLDTVNLHAADLSGRVMPGARLTGVELSDCVLRDADLGGATLTDCHAARIDARRLRLDGAALTQVHALNADLRDASLRMAVMQGCWFPEVLLEGADRTGLVATSSVFRPEGRA